jgi:hypothetical protein
MNKVQTGFDSGSATLVLRIFWRICGEIGGLIAALLDVLKDCSTIFFAYDF